MAISALRTVNIQARLGRDARWPVWPMGEPGEMLDYSANVSEWLADAGDDALISVALSIRPSGTGECQPTSLAVENGVITAMLPGGPPARDYLCRFQCVTLGGRTFKFFVRRPIDPLLARGRAVGRPPNTNFGEPVTWAYVGSFDLSNPLNSGYIALLAGF